MRERLQRFMIGRYGLDEFGRFLSVLILLLCLLTLFNPSDAKNAFTFLIIIFWYYRILSKNHNKRYQENLKYLELKDKLLHRFQKKKNNNTATGQDQYKIYTCPECKQKIRVPKGRGAIMITCPKCHTEFKKRT